MKLKLATDNVNDVPVIFVGVAIAAPKKLPTTSDIVRSTYINLVPGVKVITWPLLAYVIPLISPP